jgi:hypothetical protein
MIAPARCHSCQFARAFTIFRAIVYASLDCAGVTTRQVQLLRPVGANGDAALQLRMRSGAIVTIECNWDRRDLQQHVQVIALPHFDVCSDQNSFEIVGDKGRALSSEWWGRWALLRRCRTKLQRRVRAAHLLNSQGFFGQLSNSKRQHSAACAAP